AVRFRTGSDPGGSSPKDPSPVPRPFQSPAAALRSDEVVRLSKNQGGGTVVRKLLVLVVSALAVAVALAASGSAFAAGGGDVPRRDGGQGVWFKRVCAIPGAAIGACGAQVVTSSEGAPHAGGSPAPTALSPAQFHSAYGLPTTAPTAQTIAIV